MNRREFGRLALAGLPASWLAARSRLSARAKIDSRIHDVQIGGITYRRAGPARALRSPVCAELPGAPAYQA